MNDLEALFDDLLDRRSMGELDQSGERELEDLAASDPVLSMELTRVRYLDDDEDDLSADDAEALERVLARMAPTQPARRNSRTVRWMLIACSLLVCGGAAALWGSQSTDIEELPERPSPVQETAPSEPIESPLEDVAQREADPPAVPEADDSALDDAPVSPTTARRVRRSPPLNAGELFSRAGQARRSGDAAGAVRLYRQLQHRYPDSSEELASRFSLGRILLQRMGNPSGALRLFDSYLASAPGGRLAPEARYNRALALRRLGRSQAERRALNALLALDPNSPHVAYARTRLDALAE